VEVLEQPRDEHQRREAEDAVDDVGYACTSTFV
jgi:hypothetical protein